MEYKHKEFQHFNKYSFWWNWSIPASSIKTEPKTDLIYLKPASDITFLFAYNQMAWGARFKIQIWFWSYEPVHTLSNGLGLSSLPLWMLHTHMRGWLLLLLKKSKKSKLKSFVHIDLSLDFFNNYIYIYTYTPLSLYIYQPRVDANQFRNH